jgi:hypothetical protein
MGYKFAIFIRIVDLICDLEKTIINLGREILKNQFVILSIAFILSACASVSQYDWVKEGASQNQKTDALSECQYQIRLNKTPGTEQAELLKLCMQGKGFRIKRVN